MKYNAPLKEYHSILKCLNFNDSNVSLKEANALLKKINDSENIDFKDENPCSEYIENIFIIITNMYNLLKVDDKWGDIYNKLKTIKNQDKNKNENITSKIKFKIMDIIDFVENKI